MSAPMAARSAVRHRFLLGSGPLRRGTDRAEALSRLAVAVLLLLAVPAGLAVGRVAVDDLQGTAAAQSAARSQVSAVLLADAETDVGRSGMGVPDVDTPARWTSPDGEPREGDVAAPAGTTAGESVPIWVDAEGNLAVAPLNPDAATVEGVIAGVVTALLVAVGALAAHAALVWSLDRARDRRWTREWARLEPRWAGRTTRDA